MRPGACPIPIPNPRFHEGAHHANLRPRRISPHRPHRAHRGGGAGRRDRGHRRRRGRAGRARGEDWFLAKVDSQVEGVHFLKDAISPRQLGRKALAVNLSDIAAIGGQPLYALVSLALADDTEVAWVDELYHGLREEGDRYGVAVVGGNMARSTGGAFIDVFVLGRVQRNSTCCLRSGAQPGDRVLVTGRLGDSAAGLQLLLAPRADGRRTWPRTSARCCWHAILRPRRACARRGDRPPGRRDGGDRPQRRAEQRRGPHLRAQRGGRAPVGRAPADLARTRQVAAAGAAHAVRTGPRGRRGL